MQTLDKETKALGLGSDFKHGVLFLTCECGWAEWVVASTAGQLQLPNGGGLLSHAQRLTTHSKLLALQLGSTSEANLNGGLCVHVAPCADSSLITQAKGKSRLDQIVAWLGGETFDGCLVFDEVRQGLGCDWVRVCNACAYNDQPC